MQLGSVNLKKKKNPSDPQETVIRTAVDLVAKLHDGTTVEIPKGSYINVDDPRTLPDKLLEIGAIGEELAEKMRVKAAATPDFVKYNLSFRA